VAAAWWLQAPEVLAECLRRDVGLNDLVCYGFARGCLSLDCDDALLLRRFSEIYPEGSVNGPGPALRAQVGCRVRCHGELAVAAVAFDDPEPVDPFAFCRHLFPDRGYIEGPAGAEGWRTIASRESPEQPMVALFENFALVDQAQVWQPFIANYAVNRVLRLQRDMIFFHAASVGIEGRGVMIVGPKAAGKTTTSMTLASRGHDFFGDEMAAVERDTKALWPFRRAASLRTGPRARRVDENLAQGQHLVEKFPDGAERILVNVGSLFPEAGVSSAALACVLFLQGFREVPRAEPFAFGLEHFHMLSPLACSMWGTSAGARVMDVSRILRGTACYFLDLGPPEETANLIEQIATGRHVN
jgi:hypothetical protein